MFCDIPVGKYVKIYCVHHLCVRYEKECRINTDVSASGSSLTGVFCVKGSVLHAK